MLKFTRLGILTHITLRRIIQIRPQFQTLHHSLAQHFITNSYNNIKIAHLNLGYILFSRLKLAQVHISTTHTARKSKEYCKYKELKLCSYTHARCIHTPTSNAYASHKGEGTKNYKGRTKSAADIEKNESDKDIRSGNLPSENVCRRCNTSKRQGRCQQLV